MEQSTYRLQASILNPPSHSQDQKPAAVTQGSPTTPPEIPRVKKNDGTPLGGNLSGNHDFSGLSKISPESGNTYPTGAYKKPAVETVLEDDTEGECASFNAYLHTLNLSGQASQSAHGDVNPAVKQQCWDPMQQALFYKAAGNPTIANMPLEMGLGNVSFNPQGPAPAHPAMPAS